MLQLDIEGWWEPEDFIEVLKGVESLYYKVALRRRFLYEPPYIWFDYPRFAASSFDDHLDYSNDWLLARARAIAPQHRRLRISRIEFASPGGLDLVGLGEACKAIEGIIDRLIKFFTEREIRKQAGKRAGIETAIREVELEKENESLRSLKIENARAMMDLWRDHPEMPDEVLTALIGRDQDKLIPRIAERKLIAVRTSDGGPSEDAEAT